MTTVAELIAQLQTLNQDAVVVMSKDAEGNGFSPLSDVDGVNRTYTPDSTWSGDVAFKHLTEEMQEQGYTEDDVFSDDNTVDAVVLWPTN